MCGKRKKAEERARERGRQRGETRAERGDRRRKRKTMDERPTARGAWSQAERGSSSGQAFQWEGRWARPALGGPTCGPEAGGRLSCRA